MGAVQYNGVSIQIKPLWQNVFMVQLNLHSQPPLHNYGHPSATATFFARRAVLVADPDLQKRGGGWSQKIIFLGLWGFSLV